MKKTFKSIGIFAVILSLAFTACGGDDGNPGSSTVSVTGVTLDQAAFDLPVGSAITLIATVTPNTATNKVVTWTSDDEDIATVSATGEVTGESVGEAKIIVTTADGGFEAECTVTVKPVLDSIAITTEPDKTTYYVGDTLDITGIVVTATYSDNSTGEVTVEAANITGFDSSTPVEEQTLTVTYGGKTDTFTVTIKDHWGEWESTDIEGMEERTYQPDPTYKETRLTGTDRFAFELITSGTNANTYRVRKGTLTSGELIIPTYYRPDADSTELPVTQIGSTSDSSFSGGAFQDCTGLTSISIPNSVTSIGTSAFAGTGLSAMALETVTFTAGSQLQTISSYAFEYCTNLTGISIPDSVRSIGSYAFSNCTKLTSINIPASVYSIGIGPAYGCTLLTGITVDESNPYFTSQDGILYNKAKTNLIQVPGAISGTVAIPDSVRSIGSYAFSNCTSLDSITIPANVTSIGGSAFESTGLTGVTFAAESQLASIGSDAFRDCTGLTGITIPANVTSIGSGAFWDCTGLTGVTIPASVTSIGGMAFYDCRNLISVTFEGDAITEANFSDNAAFPGGTFGLGGNELRTAYLEGGAGEYTRTSGGSTWTKQP